ncbi:hypothetical protein [Vulgatibacter sp.]|uniref:hypothetical protein n=1 Tax=Vulgatibacter sp. TaxID=1971226 RepID=UPI00356434F6
MAAKYRAKNATFEEAGLVCVVEESQRGFSWAIYRGGALVSMLSANVSFEEACERAREAAWRAGQAEAASESK